MRLLLRRDQRSGILGKVIFTLSVRADLSPAEQQAITKYKLGDTLLYARDQIREEETMGGFARALVRHAMNLTVRARDLVDGKNIECKDILEMLAVEQQIKEAGEAFTAMLRAAMHFGGEEVLEF